MYRDTVSRGPFLRQTSGLAVVNWKVKILESRAARKSTKIAQIPQATATAMSAAHTEETRTIEER